MVASWRMVVGSLSIVCCLVVLGCDNGSPTKHSVKTSAWVTSGAAHDEHQAGDHSHGTELSPEDQALADLQKVCPVSGEPLGGDMGIPVKLMVKGEPVFICCKGCTDTVN